MIFYGDRWRSCCWNLLDSTSTQLADTMAPNTPKPLHSIIPKLRNPYTPAPPHNVTPTHSNSRTWQPQLILAPTHHKPLKLCNCHTREPPHSTTNPILANPTHRHPYLHTLHPLFKPKMCWILKMELSVSGWRTNRWVYWNIGLQRCRMQTKEQFLNYQARYLRVRYTGRINSTFAITF